MTLTQDQRTELLARAPLLHGVDPDGIAMIAARMVEVESDAQAFSPEFEARGIT